MIWHGHDPSQHHQLKDAMQNKEAEKEYHL